MKVFEYIIIIMLGSEICEMDLDCQSISLKFEETCIGDNIDHHVDFRGDLDCFFRQS